MLSDSVTPASQVPALVTRRAALATAGLTLLALWRPSRAHAQSTERDFEAALRRLQTDPSLAADIRGDTEPLEFDDLQAAPARASKSETRISERAIQLIVAAEVTSEAVYVQRYSKPIWPGKNSGVTIGIGYDLGVHNPRDVRRDWLAFLSAPTVERLQQACGSRGSAASDIATTLADISISWADAHGQFREELLPRYIGATEGALRNTAKLNGDGLGALVSLAYNRGPAFHVPEKRDKEGRFREMRAIAQYMETAQFHAIPQCFRDMKRLWGPDQRGVLIRRDAEAALFEASLRDAPGPQ